MAKVMVVDDEDALLDMIAELVEELGHQSLCAANGREAIASLSTDSDPPALIIADVMMPRMNGIELVRSIKNNPRLQHVPIILMSAGGQPVDGVQVEYFIHKPFDLDRLATLIEQSIR